MTNVIEVTKEQLEQMRQYYANDQKEPNSEYLLFSVKSMSINAYTSGKVVFQGNKAYQDYLMWIQTFGMEDEIATKEAIYFSPSYGSDEVGKGDYFGPLVVCASYVDQKNIQLLRDLHVTDSKKRSDERIIEIAKKIKDVIPHSCLVLSNEKYNDLKERDFSVVRMMAILHNQALYNVSSRVKAKEKMVIDQFCEPGVFYHYLRGQSKKVKDVVFETKAESKHISVAVSSILARYKYLIEMNRLSNEIGFELPKGGGSQVDKTIKTIIDTHGEERLYHLGKVSFQNTTKAKEL